MNKLLDFLFLPLTLWLATFIRFHLVLFEVRELYLLMSGFIAWAVAASILRIYSGEEKSGSIYRRITTIIAFFFIMTGLSFYAHNELQFSRIVLILFSLFQLLFPLAVRTILFKLFASKNHPSRYESLLIGNGKLFLQICDEYTERNKSFKSHVMDCETPLSTVAMIKGILEESPFEEIVLISDILNSQRNDAVLDFARSRGIRVQFVADNLLLARSPLKAETIGSRTYFRPLINRLERHDNRIAKRLLDIFGSLFLIVIVSPILAVAALVIKFSSPKEPVLFRQKRTGYNQKFFNCYKFRSMSTNDESDTKQAVKGDSRITKFGLFIRRTSIDELPQFLNVLRGDMSLVGPRPHPVVMNDLKEQVPEYLLRHFVSPGITGWAQINGWRGPTDTDERIQKRIECDLWYVENWSIWLDFKILFLTIFSRKTWDGAF